jgi:hypothetical protein
VVVSDGALQGIAVGMPFSAFRGIILTHPRVMKKQAQYLFPADAKFASNNLVPAWSFSKISKNEDV